MSRLPVQSFFEEMLADVRALLGGASVALVLDCPDARLAHPYLALLPAGSLAGYGRVELLSLLRYEPVRALCDLACQSGYVCTLDSFALPDLDDGTRRISIASLHHPAGVLGFLVLIGRGSDDFGEGEASLLTEYLASRIEDVEKAARLVCSNVSGLPLRESYGMGNTRQLDGQRNEFISMITHELRSPLAAIKGYAGLLQAYSITDRSAQQSAAVAITPERQQRFLNSIMEQTRHLEVLVDDLLDVSRMQAGKLALRFSPVDADALCQHVIYLARLRLPQPSLYSIACHISPNLPLIWADPHRLQQVLTNVLDNAIKYSPGGGPIDLATTVLPPAAPEREEVPQVCITVRDRGIGIPESQQALLFRPFSRLDHPHVKRVPGMGLGLFLARTLVEAMGGMLELQSNEGVGTTIIMRFPVYAPKATHQSEGCSLALSLRKP